MVDAYTFPLAWRWTKPTHNVLPPDVMAQIRPLPQGSMADVPYELIEEDGFDDIRSTSADGPEDDVRAWLRALPIDLAQKVIVRWDRDTNIETTWEIFTRYWDDFCYPASDDVEVSTPPRDWLVWYHHDELFVWGRRKAGAESPE